MKIEQVRAALQTAIEDAAEDISSYAVHPEKDFTRKPKKLSPNELLSYLITEGGKSTRNEILDVGINASDPPTEGALTRAREKLAPAGVEACLHKFNQRVLSPLPESANGFRRLAYDGTRIVFQSDHRYAGDEYYIQTQPDIRGTYCMHGSFLYDLHTRTYAGGTVEPVRGYSEKDAFIKCIDAYEAPEGEKPLFIVDRNFESYNIIAHMIENGQYFIIRAKDTDSNGILRGIETPDSECWDISVTFEIVRSRARGVETTEKYVRYLDRKRRFDFLDPKSKQTYRMTIRVVRIRLDDGQHECLITNLPRDEFPPDALGREYSGRWGEETGFRDWKYTVGALHFHAAQPELVKQEIWGCMIMYNVTELIAQGEALEKPERKDDTVYHYEANFAVCTNLCRQYLRKTRHTTRGIRAYTSRLRVQLRRELVPVRPGRHYPRHMSKRVRKGKYFTYRVA